MKRSELVSAILSIAKHRKQLAYPVETTLGLISEIQGPSTCPGVRLLGNTRFVEISASMTKFKVVDLKKIYEALTSGEPQLTEVYRTSWVTRTPQKEEEILRVADYSSTGWFIVQKGFKLDGRLLYYTKKLFRSKDEAITYTNNLISGNYGIDY